MVPGSSPKATSNPRASCPTDNYFTQMHSTHHNMSVVSFCICMFDKVINDKEVSVKVTFMLFGNHCCHPLVVQGECNSAIANNKFG
jgi:hypothetical protein